MYQCKNKLVQKLASHGVIVDDKEPSFHRFIHKTFITTSSIADALMCLAIEKQGLSKYFRGFQYWEENNLPNVANRTKGGLNKVYVQTPSLIRNVDVVDIYGAYTNVMALV
jgi:hypothetical protein